MFLPALPMASETIRAPSGCLSPACRQKAHGTLRLSAGRYGVFGIFAAFRGCSNRQLPLSSPVYQLSITETSCAAVDLAFLGVPK